MVFHFPDCGLAGIITWHEGENAPERVQQYPVPLLDIEIGSSPASWANEGAARVLARSLPAVFKGVGRRLRNLVCAGGVHFEPAFANAVFQQWDHSAFGISHILANQWLVTGKYEDPDGPARLEACAGTIRGGIEGIAFYDNLKGVYKDRSRKLAADLGIPVFKHQALRHSLGQVRLTIHGFPLFLGYFLLFNDSPSL